MRVGERELQICLADASAALKRIGSGSSCSLERIGEPGEGIGADRLTVLVQVGLGEIANALDADQGLDRRTRDLQSPMFPFVTGIAQGNAMTLFGWFVVAMMPNRYVSQARFYVDTQSLLNPLLKGISVNSDDRVREEQVALMQRTLTSRPNLMKVAQMTDLDKTAESEAELQALIQSLEERITIKAQGGNLFQVEFTDNSPATARDVVQSLLTIFVESSVGDKREDIQTAKSFIESQIAEYEGQLKAAELRLADFKVNNMNFLSANAESFAVRLEAARASVKQLQADYGDAVAQRNQLRAQLSMTPRFLSYDALPQAMGNGTVAGTPQQRILALQAKLSDLQLQYTDKHPDVVQTRAQLENLIEQQKKSRAGNTSDDAANGAG